MAKTLTLNVNLDRPKFDTGDGVIEFRIMDDFTPENVARAMTLQERIQKARVGAAEADPQAIEDLSQAILAMVDLILPELPEAVRDRLSIGQLSQIITFWNAEQGTPEGNA